MGIGLGDTCNRDDYVCPPFDPMPYQEKRCIKCKKRLSSREFGPHGGTKYFRTECRKCGNRLQRSRDVLRKKYGDPPANYRCPICGLTEEEVQHAGGLRSGAWVVDHNHDTNRFRGWLCHKCNRALGVFHTPMILKNATWYLEQEYSPVLSPVSDLEKLT